MAQQLENVAKDLNRSLANAEARTVAHLGVESAKALQRALETGIAPDGSTIAPNTEYTKAVKAKKKAISEKAGIRKGGLLKSLKGAVQVIDAQSVEVYGSNGAGKNDLKATLLIHGQKRVKGGKEHVQVPRDFVGVDEKVLEAETEAALDRTWKAWGFR